MRNKGLTLIETVISLVILGAVLVISGQLIAQNQRLTTRQILVSQANEDVRLAMLRLGEVVSQASYIYPLGSVIQLPGGGTVTTGDTVLAMLVPSNTAYCRSVASADLVWYCGFLYRTEARSGYTAVLGSSSRSLNNVLVERRFTWISWPRGGAPSTNWSGLTLGDGTPAVVADSVDTAVLRLNDLILAGSNGVIDSTLRVRDTSNNPLALNSPTALIGAVRPLIHVRFNNGIQARRTEVVMARGIPRVAPPGTGN